ncbi:MAG TPA: DinB family protein [Blastocatellia bacterium]|nr:DinB family protein [Blastocatellia bacterium]
MLTEAIVRSWKQAREALLAELEQIPADKFDFKATPETRTVAEIVKHILGAQKVFVGEVCQYGHALTREAVFGGVKQYGDEIANINDKDGLVSLLKANMEWAESKVCEFGDGGLQEPTTRLDGKPSTRFELIQFIIGHEMYHWGQIGVYERLLGIEPALTVRFKKAVAEQSGD